MTDQRPIKKWVQKGPLPLQAGYYPLSEAVWRKSWRSPLEFRDLGLSGNSNGVLNAQHMRAAGGKAGNRAGWFSDDIDMSYIHVMKGELELETDKGEKVVLKRGDTVILPPFNFKRDVFRFTGDFEALEFTSTGGFALIEKSEKAIGHQLKPIKTDGIMVNRDDPSSYVAGNGPRSFFSYRDLGATEATGGRIHIHIVGIVDQPPGGTGWHRHTMDQFFMPFTGYLDISVENLGTVRMTPGDAMYIPAGLRHDVTAFNKEYTVTEICIPTDYDTIPTDKPAA